MSICSPAPSVSDSSSESSKQLVRGLSESRVFLIYPGSISSLDGLSLSLPLNYFLVDIFLETIVSLDMSKVFEFPAPYCALKPAGPRAGEGEGGLTINKRSTLNYSHRRTSVQSPCPLTLYHLVSRSASQHVGQVHICSALLARVHLSVLVLIVSNRV